MLRVTVVYLTPARTWSREVLLAPGSTLADAVAASRLLEEHGELASSCLDLGVFGRARPAISPLRDGDRVEVYRRLTVDPKEARRIRADVRRRRA